MKIPKLLPSSQKDTFVTSWIEINTVLGIFNNKGLKNFNVRPNHTILSRNRCWLMKSLYKFKCYEIGYAELSEKRESFQEIPAPKKVTLLKK